MSQSTALAVAPSAAPMARSFSQEEKAILKATIMSGASDMELSFFLQLCQHKGLDPFSGQIVAVSRKSWNRDKNGWDVRWVYQTTIDGLRAQAESTGEFEGCDAPEWCGSDGVWREVWLDKAPPAAARVRAFRRGRSKPGVGIANFDFYCQTFKDKGGAERPNEIWRKGPAHMLAKCAEALALRKAFPRELGGLVSREELSGAGVIDVESDYQAPPVPTTSDLVGAPPDPSAPDDDEPEEPHVSQPLPSSGDPSAGAGSSPPPAAATKAAQSSPAAAAPSAARAAAGGGSPAERAKSLAQELLTCKTEAAIVARAPDVNEIVAVLGADSPIAGDLQRIYSEHRKTLKRAAAPRGPEPAKAKSAPAPARRDDEPPPPTDEDR